MNRKHREEFEVLFYHLDRNGMASVKSMLNFMQAAANMHGKKSGTSLDDFSEESYTWVFSRFHLEMHQYPEHYDRICVETWRSMSEKCFAFREFKVLKNDGVLLGAATASAVLIDKKSRKPTDIPGFIRKQFAPEEGRALDDQFLPMEEPLNDDHCRSFHVRLSDIDLNQHVNNTGYVEWIIESLPEGLLMNFRLASLEIGYKAEAFYGDTVLSCSGHEKSWQENGRQVKSFLHRLKRKSDKRITTIAKTVWYKES